METETETEMEMETEMKTEMEMDLQARHAGGLLYCVSVRTVVCAVLEIGYHNPPHYPRRELEISCKKRWLLQNGEFCISNTRVLTGCASNRTRFSIVYPFTRSACTLVRGVALLLAPY